MVKGSNGLIEKKKKKIVIFTNLLIRLLSISILFSDSISKRLYMYIRLLISFLGKKWGKKSCQCYQKYGTLFGQIYGITGIRSAAAAARVTAALEMTVSES